MNKSTVSHPRPTNVHAGHRIFKHALAALGFIAFIASVLKPAWHREDHKRPVLIRRMAMVPRSLRRKLRKMKWTTRPTPQRSASPGPTQRVAPMPGSSHASDERDGATVAEPLRPTSNEPISE